MFEIDEEVEGGADYRCERCALDVGDKADAARVVFVAGPYKPWGRWSPVVRALVHNVLLKQTLLNGEPSHNKSAIYLYEVCTKEMDKQRYTVPL